MSGILADGVTEHKIGFGGVGPSFVQVVFFGVLTGVSYAGIVLTLEGSTWMHVLSWLGLVLFGVVFLFLPSLIAYDVSYRIPRVEALKDSDPRFKDISINHRYFWVIFILNLIFGATGLVWLVLFFWAHVPGSVIIPSSVVQALEEKTTGSEQPDQAHADQSPAEPEQSEEEHITSPLEAKLRELKRLVDSGLISEAEAKDKRQALLEKD